MLAEIITIGDELLLGQTIDTNSAWMGSQLAAHGIRVHRITSISDESEAIRAALDESLLRVDFVLITGGLGPTRDDITKQTLADYFDTQLVMDQAILERITQWFAGRGFDMLEANRHQAMMPEGCKVLVNPRGTAMGMWFERDAGQKVVVSMPGVPYEMKGLMEEEVLPRVDRHWELPTRYHRTLLTQGVGESYLSELVWDWEEQLESRGVSIAYLPAPGQVRVRLSSVDSDLSSAKDRVEAEVAEFLTLAGRHVVSDRDEPLGAAVVRILTQRKKTLATAESCTGGAIASSITAVPGSSAIFIGSVVAYDNRIKQELLGVSSNALDVDGAVSEAVVCQMAKGARELLGTDYAVATSGVAGPSGGSVDKPVGTVWIALAGREGVEAKCLRLGNSRARNIERSMREALALIIRSAK
ncbi:MAG: competence/damage-inducible protein A [Crocinitomicaceae bacterium]|nr:competence/damage-inducible protein A [Crocinitomicaceae bacterium]